MHELVRFILLSIISLFNGSLKLISTIRRVIARIAALFLTSTTNIKSTYFGVIAVIWSKEFDDRMATTSDNPILENGNWAQFLGGESSRLQV